MGDERGFSPNLTPGPFPKRKGRRKGGPFDFGQGDGLRRLLFTDDEAEDGGEAFEAEAFFFGRALDDLSRLQKRPCTGLSVNTTILYKKLINTCWVVLLFEVYEALDVFSHGWLLGR